MRSHNGDASPPAEPGPQPAQPQPQPVRPQPPRSICDRLDRSLGVIAGRMVSAVIAELPPAQVVPELGHGELSGLAFAGVELFARCLREDRLPISAELALLKPSVALSAPDEVASEAMLMAHHIGARITLEEVARLAGPGEEDDVIAVAVFLQRFLPMLIPGVGAVAATNTGHAAQRELLRELVGALLAGAPAEVLADRAGVVLGAAHVVAVLRARQPGAPDRTGRYARRLHEAFGTCFGPAVPVAVDDDGRGATALLPVDDDDTAAVIDRIPALLAAATEALDGALVDASVVAADRRARLPEAHEQATELLRLARALERAPGLFQLADLLVEYQLTRPGVALPAIEHLLDGLEGRPDLQRTLRTYLALDLRRQEAATALHIHPNTLDYRLRRIAELTGADPTTARGLHLLSAGLTARAARRDP
ncbi:hypothetical protein CcI49_21935 [Frankia sp. CcI49]|uniref:PucR family transcriptional regulator n=1 Tax=Frankia sp. CcI49 TaxID=1745382 RepID=UPI000977F685|nr:helix-turn-helix domain-containing protein [Frankia sp. CcI49]ONH58176.1 hypothetical protein CcI49_21935 [Frankia sp. CcI49]